MSSTGTSTPNLQLNQWQSSDKPERLDFNADNQKIDQAFADVHAQLANKADADDTGWLELPLLGEATGTTLYRRMGGMVYFYGGVSTVKQDDVFAVLPEGFRPRLYPAFLCPINSKGGDQAMISVRQDGTMAVFWSSKGDSSTSIILNGIFYIAYC